MDPSGSAIFVLVAAYINKRKEALTIFKLDPAGNIKASNEVMPAVSDKFLISARLRKISDDDMMVIGTYNMEPERIPTNDDQELNQAAGVFISRFDDGSQKYINYYNFLEFDNLRTGLTRKEYYKMQRRMAREGSEFSLNYSMLLHDIRIIDDQLVFFMESYYPDFRTVSDITYDYWGRPIPQSYTIFEGYKFISTIVVAFDSQGNMLWDNSMEMYSINTFSLDTKIGIIADSTDIVLYYNEGGRISYKVIDKDISLTDMEHTRLEPYYRGDNIQESGYEEITHWHDGTFLCHGYQRLKNNSLVEQHRRTIFYFSKIAFE